MATTAAPTSTSSSTTQVPTTAPTTRAERRRSARQKPPPPKTTAAPIATPPSTTPRRAARHAGTTLADYQAAQAAYERGEITLDALIAVIDAYFDSQGHTHTPSQTTPSQTTPSQTTPSQTTPSQTTPSQTTRHAGTTLADYQAAQAAYERGEITLDALSAVIDAYFASRTTAPTTQAPQAPAPSITTRTPQRYTTTIPNYVNEAIDRYFNGEISLAEYNQIAQGAGYTTARYLGAAQRATEPRTTAASRVQYMRLGVYSDAQIADLQSQGYQLPPGTALTGFGRDRILRVVDSAAYSEWQASFQSVTPASRTRRAAGVIRAGVYSVAEYSQLLAQGRRPAPGIRSRIDGNRVVLTVVDQARHSRWQASLTTQAPTTAAPSTTTGAAETPPLATQTPPSTTAEATTPASTTTRAPTTTAMPVVITTAAPAQREGILLTLGDTDVSLTYDEATRLEQLRAQVAESHAEVDRIEAEQGWYPAAYEYSSGVRDPLVERLRAAERGYRRRARRHAADKLDRRDAANVASMSEADRATREQALADLEHYRLTGETRGQRQHRERNVEEERAAERRAEEERQAAEEVRLAEEERLRQRDIEEARANLQAGSGFFEQDTVLDGSLGTVEEAEQAAADAIARREAELEEEAERERVLEANERRLEEARRQQEELGVDDSEQADLGRGFTAEDRAAAAANRRLEEARRQQAALGIDDAEQLDLGRGFTAEDRAAAAANRRLEEARRQQAALGIDDAEQLDLGRGFTAEDRAAAAANRQRQRQTIISGAAAWDEDRRADRQEQEIQQDAPQQQNPSGLGGALLGVGQGLVGIPVGAWKLPGAVGQVYIHPLPDDATRHIDSPDAVAQAHLRYERETLPEMERQRQEENEQRAEERAQAFEAQAESYEQLYSDPLGYIQSNLGTTAAVGQMGLEILPFGANFVHGWRGDWSAGQHRLSGGVDTATLALLPARLARGARAGATAGQLSRIAAAEALPLGNPLNVDLASVGRQYRDLGRAALDPNVIPVSALESRRTTIRAPIEAYGDMTQDQVMAARDWQAIQRSQTGAPAAVELPDGRFLEVRRTATGGTAGPGVFHATPFSNTLTTPSGTRITGIEGGLYHAPDFHSRFTDATSRGVVSPTQGEIIWSRGPEALEDLTGSGKLFKTRQGTLVEQEILTPTGNVIRPRPTSLRTIDETTGAIRRERFGRIDAPVSDLRISIVGDDPTLGQRIALKARGAQNIAETLNPIGFAERQRGWRIIDAPSEGASVLRADEVADLPPGSSSAQALDDLSDRRRLDAIQRQATDQGVVGSAVRADCGRRSARRSTEAATGDRGKS